LTNRLNDPRNISDKQFMSSSIRTLLEYLARHNFDHAINPKILSRPAVKDFTNIVSFLFKQIDPNYVSSGKIEDEVVTMFKYLGYPIQISKSNIAAVGSPHAWPSLLASLMWLIELLAYDEVKQEYDVNEEIDSADSNDDFVSGKAFFAYLRKGYQLFLAGEDDRYDKVEEEFVSSIEGKNNHLREQISVIEQRNMSLLKEIEQLENRRAYLPELEKRKQDYQKDLGKFNQLIEQLEKHKEQLEGKAKTRDVELKKMQVNITTIKQEIESINERISTQEISPEDVKKMVAERESLEAAQLELSEQRQLLNKKVWEIEINFRDRLQNLVDVSRAYTSIAEDLKLVPHTARNARGKHLKIEIDQGAKKRDGLLKADVKNEILPALQVIRTELNETTGKYKSEILLQQDYAEESDLKISEMSENLAQVESKLKRYEEAYKREREAFDQAAELHSKEMDAMEARLVRLCDTAVEEARSTAASRRAAETRAARDTLRQEHQRKKREMMKAIMDVVAECANHRELVQGKLAQLKSVYGERLESLLGGEKSQVVGEFIDESIHKSTLDLSVNKHEIIENTVDDKDIELSLVQIEDVSIVRSADKSINRSYCDENVAKQEPVKRNLFNLNGILEKCTSEQLDDSVRM
jgi:kinetochore protein NDC80